MRSGGPGPVLVGEDPHRFAFWVVGESDNGDEVVAVSDRVGLGRPLPPFGMTGDNGRKQVFGVLVGDADTILPDTLLDQAEEPT